jgi:hypothetical protein
MSGFTDYQASGASDVGRKTETILTWAQAQAMLPLVQRVARDIVHQHEELAHLHLEKEGLDEKRFKLEWPGRERRYQVAEEILRREGELMNARSEMEFLGVALLDEEEGRVGFPTLVNDQRAYFTWKPGDELVAFWQFADSTRRRPVPEEWKDTLVSSGKGR